MLAIIGLILFVGVILWAINAAPFIDGNFKKIIYIIVVVAVVIYLLKHFGMMPHL